MKRILLFFLVLVTANIAFAADAPLAEQAPSYEIKSVDPPKRMTGYRAFELTIAATTEAVQVEGETVAGLATIYPYSCTGEARYSPTHENELRMVVLGSDRPMIKTILLVCRTDRSGDPQAVPRLTVTWATRTESIK